jgi:putative tricarboxylic transport membrane protein
MRANDFVTGLILIVFATAMIAYTGTFPPFPGQKYGPALFPRILGSGMILCGVLLMLRGRRLLAAGEPMFGLDPVYRQGRAAIASLAIVVAILFYALASNALGFVPTAFILLLSLLLLYGTRPVTALIIAIVAVLFMDWFFGWMFRVPLPLGLLPNSPSAAVMNLIRGRG